MSLEILPYSTPTGIRHYVPLEDYQRALDNLDKLENGNMAMREAIKEAYAALKELRSFYIEMTNLPPCLANAALAKLKPFLTELKQHEQTKHQH